MNKLYRFASAMVLGATISLSLFTTAFADNILDGTYWAHKSLPVTIIVENNMSSNWDSFLNTAARDWSSSTVVNMKVVRGNQQNSKLCNPKLGRIEICNYKYGLTGWLGLTTSTTNDGVHISQSTVKINDTYFEQAQFNTGAWKQFTLCHELGHSIGLDHQDEDFYNPALGTCMDLTIDPKSNQHPNTVDYKSLINLYSKTDPQSINATTVSTSAVSNVPESSVTDDPSTWGTEAASASDGTSSTYVKELSNGERTVTRVYWKNEHIPKKADN